MSEAIVYYREIQIIRLEERYRVRLPVRSGSSWQFRTVETLLDAFLLIDSELLQAGYALREPWSRYGPARRTNPNQ